LSVTLFKEMRQQLGYIILVLSVYYYLFHSICDLSVCNLFKFFFYHDGGDAMSVHITGLTLSQSVTAWKTLASLFLLWCGISWVICGSGWENNSR